MFQTFRYPNSTASQLLLKITFLQRVSSHQLAQRSLKISLRQLTRLPFRSSAMLVLSSWAVPTWTKWAWAPSVFTAMEGKVSRTRLMRNTLPVALLLVAPSSRSHTKRSVRLARILVAQSTTRRTVVACSRSSRLSGASAGSVRFFTPRQTRRLVHSVTQSMTFTPSSVSQILLVSIQAYQTYSYLCPCFIYFDRHHAGPGSA